MEKRAMTPALVSVMLLTASLACSLSAYAAEAAVASPHLNDTDTAATSSKKPSKPLAKVAPTKKAQAAPSTTTPAGAGNTTAEEVNQLKEQLAIQQQQITELLRSSAEQKETLAKALQVIQSMQTSQKPAQALAEETPPSHSAEVASLRPMVPSLPGAAKDDAVISTASLPAAPPSGGPGDEALVQG
jgi:hypothetical protein